MTSGGYILILIAHCRAVRIKTHCPICYHAKFFSLIIKAPKSVPRISDTKMCSLKIAIYKNKQQNCLDSCCKQEMNFSVNQLQILGPCIIVASLIPYPPNTGAEFLRSGISCPQDYTQDNLNLNLLLGLELTD